MNCRRLQVVLSLLVAFTSALAAAQQFIVAPKLPGAPATYTLAADVNGDGNSDLVLLGYNVNSRQTVLTILLGNGAGNFNQAQQITQDNVQPRAIATGDWNGDGIPDLALGEIFPNTLAIYLGVGDGTFTAGNQYSLGDFVDGIAAGDLNGDGIADLITSNDLGTLSVLLGQGGGNFGAPVNYSLGSISEAEEVIVADFNRDGKLDVAVALPESSSDGSLAVLLGKGDGSLQTAVQYSTGTSFALHLVAADFNHDGILDIATAGTFFLGVLVGNGDGTFQTAKSYATIRDSGPIRVSDLNGDGNPDVVAVNTTYQPFAIAVFLGNADGSF
ncbi:MAG: VCBS repeat-containing protein, partial [Acidobacteriales bacterium]|nr:VCBS repeat-containing protein [Terriglobales bacterium]